MLSLKVKDDTELRLFAEEDAEEIFQLVKGNYEHLHPFLHWVTEDYSLEGARDFIGQTQKAFAENASRTFGIFQYEKIVGVIGFVKFNWQSKRTEIGYWIDKNREGEGIATGSCRVLINYAFEELGMNRIEIRCAMENVRSRAIPERLNFKLDGVLRQSEWRHTRFFDMAIYSMLADEWKQNEK
jgi:ribosomal-protein-serine acetyltransferase